jgi:AraC-like DNA-binding protein
MSRKRQRPKERDPERGLLVRTYAVTHPNGLDIAPRAFDWHQLVYASQGVMSVHTSEGTWVVPPHRAVWIPRGVEHAVEMAGRVSLRTLFFAASFARGLPRSCQAVNVSPLLRELILQATRLGLLRRNVRSQARLARVILDQLQTLSQTPLQLPAPSDPRARRATELLRQNAGEPISLAAGARGAGASQRTLERLFRRETQMTLGRWRQRLRFVQALRLLAAGHAVTQVAIEVGYRSPSAFVSAFRRQLGTTPGRYFDPPPPA